MGPPHSPRATLTRPSLLPDLAALTLNSGSSGASDQDTLAPLPHPAAPWPLGQGYPYQYPGPPPCFPPAYQDPGFGYGSGSAGSQQSEGERSGPALPCPARCPAAILAPLLCACQRQAPNWSQSWGTGSSPMQGPQAPGGLGACAWWDGGWCCRCGSQEAGRWCDRGGGGGGPRHQERSLTRPWDTRENILRPLWSLQCSKETVPQRTLPQGLEDRGVPREVACWSRGLRLRGAQ